MIRFFSISLGSVRCAYTFVMCSEQVNNYILIIILYIVIFNVLLLVY